MNGVIPDRCIRCLGFWAVLLLSAISAKANPIEVGMPESPFPLGTIVPITLAILIEAVCISLLLMCRRTPHLFILWLIGMHFLTYPAFLGFLWLTDGYLHPVFAIISGESSVVLIEAALIYLVCRFLPSVNIALPTASFLKCLFASFIGNICSVVAFPILSAVSHFVFRV